MLFKKAEPDPKLKHCHVNGMNYELFMFPYQETIQKALVVIAVLMIPIMLLGKPLVIIIIIVIMIMIIMIMIGHHVGQVAAETQLCQHPEQ